MGLVIGSTMLGLLGILNLQPAMVGADLACLVRFSIGGARHLPASISFLRGESMPDTFAARCCGLSQPRKMHLGNLASCVSCTTVATSAKLTFPLEELLLSSMPWGSSTSLSLLGLWSICPGPACKRYGKEAVLHCWMLLDAAGICKPSILLHKIGAQSVWQKQNKIMFPPSFFLFFFHLKYEGHNRSTLIGNFIYPCNVYS